MNKIILLLLSLYFISCSELPSETKEEQGVGKSYRITQINKPDTLFEKGDLLTFYPDDTYTLISVRGVFTENKSRERENGLSLFIKNSQESSFETKKEGLQLQLTREGGDYPLEIILVESEELQYHRMDLLTSGRNWWRVKPPKKESNLEVEQRLVAHLCYILDYFHIIEETQAGAFSTDYLNLPFRLYRNGIALISPQKLPEGWSDMFYDEQNGEYAYEKLKNAILSIKKYPRDDQSHIKGFSDSFKMMILHIENSGYDAED